MLSKSSTGRTNSVKPPIPKPSTRKPKDATPSKRISSKLDTKVVHPLGQDTHKTAFSSVYARGGIPCRLCHGSVKHKLTWIKEPFTLDYNPLLVTFFEGLKETQHPYIIIVKLGLHALLDAPGSADKIIPILKAIILPLRLGLTSKNNETFITALECVIKLSSLVGPMLVPHLGLLLPPIANRVLGTDANTRDLSYEALGHVEAECGSEALKHIRSRVPTYSSIYSLK